MTLSFMWIDAFTETPLTGNPCLVILNGDGLTAAQMQSIAREANLSETAFILSSEVAQFRARYFTPAEEIPLAGHPTMAVTRALIDSGRLPDEQQKFTLQLEAGVIEVERRAGDFFFMAQKKPEFKRIYTAEEIAPVFGLSPEDIISPVQTVSTGTPQLMIHVNNLEALRGSRLDNEAYIQLREAGDFFSPHLFYIVDEGKTFARHYGTPPDTAEDPFTGSATGGMGAYLWHHGLIPQPEFIAEQGHWMGRPGQGFVEVIGAPDDIQTVKVGGQAVRVMTGEMDI